MANRFYRSSAPRYTSQFVEERYPEDLILQSGAMKYAQKQQFAKDVGELSALNNMLQPGYRTREVAYGNGETPGVINKWNDQINQFIGKYQTNYDSPQALMELSQLRYSWQGDKDVQLIQQDREVGNKQYDDIRRATKTYSMDYDPNVDPTQGTVKQFRSGEPFKPYDPLINFEDTDKYAFDMFNQVRGDVREGQSRSMGINPITGLPEEVITRSQVEYRDMNKLQPVVETLVQGVLNNTMPGASYLKTKFRDKYGNPREPKAEELRAYFTEQAKKAQYSEIRGSQSYKDIDTTAGTKGKNEFDIGRLNLEMVDKPDEYKDWTKKLNNQLTLAAKSDPNFKVEDHAEMYNLHKLFENNDAYKGLKTWKERSRYIRDNYTKPENQNKYNLAIDPFGVDEKKFFNTTFLGQINPNEKINVSTASSFFKGIPIYEYNKNGLIQDIDGKSLVKKDSSVDFLGRVDTESIGKSIKPGMVAVSIDDKQYLIQIPKFADEERPIHDLLGMDRTVSGIGDGFAISFGFGEKGEVYNPLIQDVNNSNKDDKEIDASADNTLYFIPMKDYSDNGIRKVKVYSDNPYKRYENKNMGDLLFNDDKNELYIGEYNIDSFANTGKLYEQIINDAKQIIQPD